MATYAAYARDLRALADVLDAHTEDLPLSQYAHAGLSMMLHFPEQADVVQAARIFNTHIQTLAKGHTTTTFDVGTAHLSFVWISPAAQADYRRRMRKVS